MCEKYVPKSDVIDKQQVTMKYRAKKTMSLMLMAAIVAISCATLGACRSEQNMYGRKQTNKGATVKSNIKVKGSNKANGHTTRSY